MLKKQFVMIISIIQSFIFVIYVSFIIAKFGIIQSLSESWYRLENEKLGILFTLFCWSIGFLMFFQGKETTPLFFLSGAGLCFTGGAAQFKLRGMTDRFHTIGAVVCIACALLGLGFEYKIWTPSIIYDITAIIMSILVKKNKNFWLEIVAFVFVVVGMFAKEYVEQIFM